MPLAPSTGRPAISPVVSNGELVIQLLSLQVILHLLILITHHVAAFAYSFSEVSRMTICNDRHKVEPSDLGKMKTNAFLLPKVHGKNQEIWTKMTDFKQKKKKSVELMICICVGFIPQILLHLRSYFSLPIYNIYSNSMINQIMPASDILSPTFRLVLCFLWVSI